MPRRLLIVGGLGLALVASQPQDDPVLRARAQRAAAPGGAEGDLPPVPRGIVEPPPLPPPEAHVKDTRRGRRARGRRAKAGKVSRGKGSRKAPSKPPSSRKKK